MTANVKQYRSLKDSGVKCLGEVPEHWKVRQLGRIGRFSKGNGGTKEDEVTGGVSCVRYGDLYMHHEFFIRKSRSYVTPERAVDYTQVQYGDVLFAGSGETIEEIGKSAVNLIESEACCGGDVIIFRPSIEVEPRFMGYASDCSQAVYQKACMGRGVTVMHIYGDQLKYMWIALPTLPEQAAIARYLNHIDRRINRLIRAKRRHIELLNEQKQAIIHQAVTRGLDPNVRFKPSGIEWLGDVPEHWESTRIKNEMSCLNHIRVPLNSVERGNMTQRKYDYYGASGVIDQVDDYLFDDDLVLVAEDGANLNLRNLPLAIIARGKFWVNNHAHILKPKRGNLEYLANLLETIDYKPWISGAAQPKLTKDRLMAILISVPSAEEQNEIILFVNNRTAPLQSELSRTSREIELLREYLTRLVADVVTGKLDVRGVELPERCDDDDIEYLGVRDAEVLDDLDESLEDPDDDE